MDRTPHPRRHPRPIVLALSLVLATALTGIAQDVQLPNRKDSVHFAVIGDTGTGGSAQIKVAQMLTAARAKFPFDIVLMLGDNMYIGSSQRDFEVAFERPYKDLLAANVKFYASLGNHDNTNQRLYKPFNMNGQRYYSFKPSPLAGVRFFALDSNYMDAEQIAWMEKELAASQSDWKIMFFHHPLYSSGGTHGSEVKLREQIEPIFVKHGVDLVLAGHDHFYERVKPQKNIYHFVSGGAAKLRQGDLKPSAITEKGFDTGYHFMLFEIVGDVLHFQAVSEKGVAVDSGALPRLNVKTAKKAGF